MKNPHLKSHIILLAVALISVIVVGGLYFFMRYEITASASRAVLAEAIVEVEEADKNREQDLIALYGRTSAGRARLPSLFIPSDNVVAFIESLESIGMQSGAPVTLSSLAADSLDTAPAGTIGSVKAHVAAQGSWPAIMKVLLLSEDLPYDIAIDHLRLDGSLAPAGKSGGTVWNISYDVQAAQIATSSLH